MQTDYRLKLTFWGVRGSTPTPRIDNLNFGGNTSCVEVRNGRDDIMIFDAGTGITPLGRRLVKKDPTAEMDLKIFLTHFHWDHIQGIPFFQPLYSEGNKVTFFSFENQAEEMLRGQMTQPYFPVSFDLLPARLEFQPIDHESFEIAGTRITPFPLNHPQGCTGYRLEQEEAVIVYATDHEHGDAKHDRILFEQATGADLLVYDAQYTPQEYKERVGWGHSTWFEGCQLAESAGVKDLVLFHHDPFHHDHFLADIVKLARDSFPAVEAAREGDFYIL